MSGLPNDLTNGDTADADEVMANLHYLEDQIAAVALPLKLVEIDPTFEAALETNWSTKVKALDTGGPVTNTSGGTGLTTPTFTHTIGETPTFADVTMTNAQVSSTPQLTARDATTISFAVSQSGGFADHTYIWAAQNARGPAKKSTGAQNALLSWDVFLSAGTWELELVHNQGPDRGRYQARLDAADVGSYVEGYAAAEAFKVSTKVAGIVVAASGLHSFALKMATKHASSSSYYGHIVGVRLRRTA